MKNVGEFRLKLRSCDIDLAVVYASPSQKIASGLVVMLHGGPGGEKDGPDKLYSYLARELAGVGLASVRFDFRVVGESAGLIVI